MAEDLDNPKLAVIMAVYNGAAYVRQAIDSILAQTFRDFELIIINDGSTDSSEEIIKSYDDPRIKLHNQENIGLAGSLNKGVGLVTGELIARQDADDRSEPDRLAKQVAFLTANPAVVVVGSSTSVMDGSSRMLHEHRVLLNDPELKQELLVRSPFAHGSVVFRKAAFDKAGGYSTDEWPAEDYGLWLRIAQYGAFANLDEPLYVYREWATSTSSQNAQLQEQKKLAVQAGAWRLRKNLLSGRIDAAGYPELSMGQFRVERITRNLLFTLRKSLLRLNLVTALLTVNRLITDRGLRRKCARLIAVRLGLKHV